MKNFVKLFFILIITIPVAFILFMTIPVVYESSPQEQLAQCNMPIRSFLNENSGTFSIPQELEGNIVKSVQAVVYFHESHGGFRSCFSFKEVITGQKTDLFCEVKFSDKNTRGQNDWLGSVPGGILGKAPAIRNIVLKPTIEYTMSIWGNLPPHDKDARSTKTNFIDPVPDGNPKTFTFYEDPNIDPPKPKSIPVLNPQGFSVSTIIGFEDGYKQEEIPDYNDVIIEICLKIDY